jgi:hypothetical protein
MSIETQIECKHLGRLSFSQCPCKLAPQRSRLGSPPRMSLERSHYVIVLCSRRIHAPLAHHLGTMFSTAVTVHRLMFWKWSIWARFSG